MSNLKETDIGSVFREKASNGNIAIITEVSLRYEIVYFTKLLAINDSAMVLWNKFSMNSNDFEQEFELIQIHPFEF